MTREKIDFAVIGAGPAGMAAATLAAELGLDTALIDEQDAPGGQIYRGVERAAAPSPLGDDYLAGRSLAAALRAGKARYFPATTVWHIDPDGTLSLIAGGESRSLRARRILVATGAIERPVPIPGWTLPGVMTLGAAQIALKTADLVPAGRTVLAGQGPLLWLVAAQLIRAGAPPSLILETTPSANRRAAAALLPGVLWPARRALRKGLGLIREVKRAGVPIVHRVTGLAARGADHVASVVWNGGEMSADLLLLHEGVIPNTQISMGLQLDHRWDEAQLCWRPVVDEWGAASLSTIGIAGDGGGIAGAEAAALSGRLAALDAASFLDKIDPAERDRRARPIRRDLQRETAIRPFLDALYRPARTVLVPSDAVIACRCEEVSVAQIRRAARLGAQGPNQAKAFTRCGMGPCQGRVCGPLVSAVMADTLGKPIAATGTYRPRAPYKPITVGALAGSAGSEASWGGGGA
ncbi:MAG TPA: NAD(P)/FAD-dependent oxidoreductase [Stellaceae bacterium]|nr:NAD(P)/FAD-dependent oxidoreductase [Stellaceae bacterium]